MGPEAELYVRPMFFVRKGLGAARPDPDSTDFILAIYDSPLPKWAGFSAVPGALPPPGAGHGADRREGRLPLSERRARRPPSRRAQAATMR
jgi:hypothetical protein